MIHPIPSGTRDVLPDETREVRAITDTMRRVFESHGYGEVYTPALEYESVLSRGQSARTSGPGEAQPAYRVFDATGLKDYRVGVGDASLYPALMASLQVREQARGELLDALVRRDFVGLERALERSGVGGEALELLLEVPQRRGGPEILADTP